MNTDELIVLIIGAILNGTMLALGMIIGTRLTAKNMRKELEDAMEKSELVQTLKKLLTNQTLTDKATKFFDEATVLVSSPEAKNFFKNVTTLIATLSKPQATSHPPPPKRTKEVPKCELSG